MGSARLKGNVLRLETNSLRRAEDLRRRVEEACPGLLVFLGREQKEAESIWKEAAKDPTAAAPRPKSPEEQAFVREFKERYYEAWMDQSIPALGGMTPRQAAGGPLGRGMLLQILKEVEHHETNLPEGERYDFSILRRKLGLT